MRRSSQQGGVVSILKRDVRSLSGHQVYDEWGKEEKHQDSKKEIRDPREKNGVAREYGEE